MNVCRHYHTDKPGAVLLTNWLVCTHFCLYILKIKWLFHMSENKQRIWKWLDHVRQLSLVMCIAYTNEFTIGKLKLRLGL